MNSEIPRRTDRQWLLWLLLLALAQAVDVLTTRVDIGRGAMEGNTVAAHVLAVNGFGGLLFVKLALVAVMGAAILLAIRYADEHPGPRARLVQGVVWRGLQLSVFVLLMTGLHNVLVLAALQGWNTPTLLTTLPLTPH